MATTQKKTTKSAPKKSGGAKKGTKRMAAPPPYNHGLRLSVGVVMLLLALCVLVNYFGGDATVLAFLSKVLKGLFGYGYYLVALALGYCGWSLIDHKKKPVILRSFCILVLPLLLGTMLHLFLCKGEYGYEMEHLKALWAEGQNLTCGGALGGSIAEIGRELVGKAVTVIVMLALMIACLIGGLRIKPREMMERARERRAEREAAYAELEEQERVLAEQKAKEKEKADAAKAKAAAKKSVHIPLDSEVEEKPLFAAVETGFFPRRAGDIKTPAEVWDSTAAEAPVEAVPAVEEAPAVAEEQPAPRRRKVSAKEEVDSAAAEVSEAIEKELAEEEEAYRYPPITLLEENNADNSMAAGFELRDNARRLADTITSFGVDAKPGDVVRGPSVTRYEFTLDQGVKLSKLTNLSDDIALALGASGVRIAPIPGKIAAVGIEVPNRTVTAVRIRDVVESRNFVTHPSNVAFAVGKDIGGNAIVGNIARLPHVLIAGTTGSGKSVCTNSLIVSLLYKSTPEEVRFIMVDPKMVELAPYNGIPHLLIPVVTDPKKAAGALQWAVFEMMKRYKMFSERGVKDLAGFNALAESDGELKKLPTVVVVIDELADLMLVAAKEVEESICRVAQMGRAAGVHLVIATQRPSADVITGLMKANIPSRIAFAVASAMESRIILDTPGAEKLVGKGDMLYFPLGDNKPTRVQGCFITPEEIERVVNFVKESGEADYSSEVMEKIEEAMKQSEKGGKGGSSGAASEPEAGEGCDEMLAAAVEVIFETGQASVSMLQRRLKLGYSRAARLVDQMEERGIVGPFEGSKPRQVLITRQQWQELQMKGGAYAPAEEPELPPIDRYGSVRDVFDSRDALE
ncbi:MAG: DNA translocase FtsK 4TM domain-containing protein [Oscillospiraceae bacterium]|nr:DNA translocase FtsK 4TM domain-containing protein [Oscillospiraceae bacterium]